MFEYEEGTVLFFLRQKLGTFICVAAIISLLLMYDKEEETGFSNNFLVLANLGVVLVGLAFHETRPYKRLEFVRKLVEDEKKEEEEEQQQQQQNQRTKKRN
eukprot:TRINITY_DN2100_c2_g1_i1.p5 TRINITY_DN2100_c2_g1~~TRINITY_DN2100_c2_g1_i1.p5  ORF type:complete len:101 (-),score=28.30 TRINITY_DN2100_c2_g1_i1:397-699(-)